MECVGGGYDDRDKDWFSYRELLNGKKEGLIQLPSAKPFLVIQLSVPLLKNMGRCVFPFGRVFN